MMRFFTLQKEIPNMGIITNDVNVQIIAYYMGIECQGYSNLGAYLCWNSNSSLSFR